MLEFDDIQHILLTRAPALTGRYEFLSFRNAAGGRDWLAAILEKVQSAAASAGFGRQGQALGDGGLHLERLAGARRGRGFAGHVSRRVQAGNGRPRRDARRHRREPSRPLGRRTGQPGPSRHRHPVRPRRRGARALRWRSTRNSSHGARASKCSRRWIWKRRRHSTTRTTTSAIATGSRSRSSKAPATCRRPAPARRSSRANSSSATRTKTGRRPICRSRKSFPATAASWPIGACRSMWAGFATSCASTARRPKNRS